MNKVLEVSFNAKINGQFATKNISGIKQHNIIPMPEKIKRGKWSNPSEVRSSKESLKSQTIFVEQFSPLMIFESVWILDTQSKYKCDFPLRIIDVAAKEQDFALSFESEHKWTISNELQVRWYNHAVANH